MSTINAHGHKAPTRVSVATIRSIAFGEQNGGLEVDETTGQLLYRSINDGSRYMADPLYELREALVGADKDIYFMLGAYIDALTIPGYSIENARDHVRQVILGQPIQIPGRPQTQGAD